LQPVYATSTAGNRFKRADLYKAVWELPLTTLGKQYGLSDNGLRKICKAMNIPLPKIGHWARVAAGHSVARVPLPLDCNRDTYVSNVQEKIVTSSEDGEDELWLKSREEFERDPANVVLVPGEVTRWHPVLRELRSLMQERLKEAARHKKSWEEWQIRSKVSRSKGPNLDVWKWSRFEAGGQLIELGRLAFPLRVTPLTWERAFRIMQTLFDAAIARGFTIKHEGEKPALIFQYRESKVYFRLSEQLAEGTRPIAETSTYDRGAKTEAIRVPTGKLRVFVGHSWSEIKLEDRAELPLEKQVNELLVRLFRKVVSERKSARKHAKWQREYEEGRQLAAQREVERLEKARLLAEEETRRNALLNEARCWRDSITLTDYISHIARRVASEDGGDCADRYKFWLDWAMRVAVELDPTARRLQNFRESSSSEPLSTPGNHS
jgi:hypothetical protein